MTHRMYTAQISYTVDVMLKEEDGDGALTILNNLTAFGARDVRINYTAYTGRGAHEFVGSKDPGLQHLQICVKCAKRRDEAEQECPGITA